MIGSVVNTTTGILATLTSHIGDATQGLPEDVFLFLSGITPLFNVDLLIKNEAGQTLLTWRADRFYPEGWHIPGGIVRFKEKITDRLAAVATNELGAGVVFEPAPLAINEVIHPSRSARGHFISFLYKCRLTSPLDEQRRFTGGSPGPAGAWAWHDGCPGNLIGVQEMYRHLIDGKKGLG